MKALPSSALFCIFLTEFINCLSFQDYLKDQFFPEQHHELKARITNELPAVSGLYCDIKTHFLKYNIVNELIFCFQLFVDM